MPEGARNPKRRQITLTPLLDRSTVIEQQARGVDVPFQARDEQWRIAVIIFLIEASALLQGSDPNIYLGTQVATGDVDGDGYIDVIGSGDYAQNATGSWGSGGTWVWLGTGM